MLIENTGKKDDTRATETLTYTLALVVDLVSISTSNQSPAATIEKHGVRSGQV